MQATTVAHQRWGEELWWIVIETPYSYQFGSGAQASAKQGWRQVQACDWDGAEDVQSRTSGNKLLHTLASWLSESVAPFP